MKTIIIEAVRNGWIVRPFQPSSDWACTDRPAMAVYNFMGDLQADLPALLGAAQALAPTPKLDSEGGNTGL